MNAIVGRCAMLLSTGSAAPILLVVMASAASSTQEYETAAEQYRRQFSEANPHGVRAVQRAGGELNAREFGAGNRSGGPSIVMMHGFPDSQHLYDLVIPPLAKTRHVITFDFLGWGDSDKPSGHRHDVSSLRKDLEAVVSAFDLRSVVLVVHDLSGQPGVDWALDNEERVSALVLLNTYYSSMAALKPPEAIARFSTPGLWRNLSVWGANRSDALWQRGVHKQISKFFATESARETFVPLFVHQALGIRSAFFGQNAVLRDEIANRDQLVPRLGQFRKPVRIVFGADDPYLNSSVAREFQRVFPGSELFLIGNAAHYVQLDQPARVAELILTSGLTSPR